MIELDALVNDFAMRCFRDIADGDYIAARMASRAALVTQFLWASQQAVEKYRRCILLLNRIEATKVYHDLGKALCKINGSCKVSLNLTQKTQKFIVMLDEYGQYRYLEVSNIAFGAHLVTLDRAVWELRRYCTFAPEPKQEKLRNGFAAPLVRVPDGYIEQIIDDVKDAARAPLLRQNAFFGKRTRKGVRLRNWFKAHNAPLYLNPEILDEVLKYVHIPKDVKDGYRAHSRS